MSEEQLLAIGLMTEKKLGHGEDAPPLLVHKEKMHVVGVFDGMGGAGAFVCNSKYGEGYTQAYVASRVVSQKVKEYFEGIVDSNDISSESLKSIIQECLNEEKLKYPSVNKSSLRSKLVREYPTTIAVVELQETDNEYIIDSFWAGDSRCYVWTRDGFFQISKDDLDCDNDPMENLRNDAALSNCICADRDFYINHKQIKFKKQPLAILATSDGVFGYFPTPMHLEHILKKCLRKAGNVDEWKNYVNEEVQKVTADDSSLALIGCGFKSFDSFKQQMSPKRIKVIGQIADIENRIENQKRELQKLEQTLEQVSTNGWQTYKKEYMKYVIEEKDA